MGETLYSLRTAAEKTLKNFSWVLGIYKSYPRISVARIIIMAIRTPMLLLSRLYKFWFFKFLTRIFTWRNSKRSESLHFFQKSKPSRSFSSSSLWFLSRNPKQLPNVLTLKNAIRKTNVSSFVFKCTIGCVNVMSMILMLRVLLLFVFS